MERWLIYQLLVLPMVVMGCSRPQSDALEYPAKPLKVIVPFDAGGGSDTFTRVVQSAIEDQRLLPQPLVVINVPGAGGTVGSRRVKNARPDGYTILQLHEGLLTSKYAGNANYGPEAFKCIAATGKMVMVVAVREDSPFGDLKELVRAAAESPDAVLFGVGIGAPSHFTGLMLEKAWDGAKFRFTQTGGGAKRFSSLLGGHTDVTTFSIAEYVDFQSSGIRALAVLSAARHPDAAEIPTAVEQGLDVVSSNMHFWWVPKGTTETRIHRLGEALQQAMNSESVRARLSEMLVDPVVLSGSELDAELKRREAALAQVAIRPVAAVPNFANVVLAALLLTGFVALVRARSMSHNSRISRAKVSWQSILNAKLIVTALATIVYVAVMDLELVAFQPATFGYVMLVTLFLGHGKPKSNLVSIILAICLSAGTYAIFTRILILDLP